MDHLHIDIETFSSVDISSAGAYKYTESLDFEILMMAYAFNDEPVCIIDFAQGEKMPKRVSEALLNKNVLKIAHNAAFERTCFKAIGLDIPVEQWMCTAIKSAYCGLPLSLDGVSKALKLGEAAKDSTGKALIRYFSVPVKPTKVNGGRVRNLYYHDPEKWHAFKNYCIQDVVAEREIEKRLEKYEIPAQERDLYCLDQKINDRGILIDLQMASNAFDIDQKYSEELTEELKALTGVDNPNSTAQLKTWLSEEMDMEIKTLSKTVLPDLIADAGAGSAAAQALELRAKNSKTSVKKYTSMLSCACDDDRAHGLFQFYGANRTGRWAGRLIQLQNLPQNHLDDLDLARATVAAGDYSLMTMLYDDVGSVLSQLIRTAFIAKRDHTFAVADFSAIEARVIAWLAGEDWRIDVFNTHGKIYEASASMMFNVPIDQITKGSDLRQKGKVAELALGYQGGVGALKTMGGERMGLSEVEMSSIVKKWRAANPSIVALWSDIEKCAMRAVITKRTYISDYRGLIFNFDGSVLTIELPSGRKLFYQQPLIGKNRFDKKNLLYMGMDQVKKTWGRVETYGGKLVENIVQAIARDILADSMIRLDAAGYEIVMHVHDEAVAEVHETNTEDSLTKMCDIMGQPIEWAKGLPLAADGYLTKYYKKD